MGELRRIYRGACDQCGVEEERLARLAVSRPDGVKRILMVCRYCYIQLKNSRA